MPDSNLHRKRLPIHSRLAEKWRFMVIMAANVWLVFVIMRFGMARHDQRPLAEPDQTVAEHGLTATLLASAALVGAVLAVVLAVFLLWHRSNRRSRLAVCPDDDGHG
ncbi:MAG TPA: hypothetical protein VG125_20055 [Pirellulales bacterium]|jgi:hypothetical protein|nr:hypothetical protein [Pirellulales bacterium]